MNWSDVGKTLRSIAGDSLPAIGTALGGPAGAAVGFALSRALGTDSTPEAVAAALNPQSLVQLKQIDADLEKTQIQADSAASTGQIEVNKAEATNESLFVSGWRPAIGWSCALAFAWTFVIAPLVAYSATLAGWKGSLPSLDLNQLMPVLLGMLGLGGMRTYEKVSGVKMKPGS